MANTEKQWKGGADGRRWKNKSRPYIQKQCDSPINVPDTDLIVSWYMHDGYTQIHIASADFSKATFDAVILPLTTQLHGVNVFPQQDGIRSYGSYVKLPNEKPTPGQVLVTLKPDTKPDKRFACNKLIAGIFDEANPDKNKDTIYKIFKEYVFEKKKKAKAIETVAVPIHFGGSLLYDPIDVVESVGKIQTNNDPKRLTLFLCFNGNESELPPFMTRVNDCVGKTESPRRLLKSPMFKDLFPTVKISTEITERGILKARCECIVAAVNNQFTLDKGKLTQSISGAAGDNLQRDLNKLHKKAFNVWDVICCDAYNLHQQQVKCILFGCLKKWNSDCDQPTFIQEVSDFVKQCLLTADDNGCVSVAFPVLGSGYLSYPNDVIVSSLFGGIDKYASEAVAGNVRKVVIAYFGGQSSPLNQLLIGESIKRSNPRWNSQGASSGHSTTHSVSRSNTYMKQTADTPDNKDNLYQSGSQGPSNLGAKPKSNSQSTNIFKTSECDVSAEVNPSIREYLLAKDIYGDFKHQLFTLFGVSVVDENGKLVLKGSLDELIKAEELIEDGSLFKDLDTTVVKPTGNHNDNDQSANSDRETSSIDENEYVLIDSPTEDEFSSANSPQHQELASSTPLATPLPTPLTTNTESKKTYVPLKVDRHEVKGSDKTWAVFTTNDLLSFRTDIKVVTTDKNFRHKNQYLSRMLEIFPECRHAWDRQQGKFHDDRHLQIVPLDNSNTCNCVFLAVVPTITSPDDVFSKTKKEAFKGDIATITRQILDKAKGNDVRSISLPLLVHTGVENAQSMCLEVMAKCIAECLRDVSTLEHVNVFCDASNIRKSFHSALKKNVN